MEYNKKLLHPEDIVCRKCSTIDEFNVELISGHLKATCKNCGGYIKHLPQPPEWITFPVGKYKGSNVYECTDTQYLEWFDTNVKTSPGVRRAVFNRLRELKKEGK